MSNMPPKISVIIPVYNTEKYLCECLDSVLGQTFKDIEVICVNDGSTDGSLVILREYEAKDSRFKVIDKPNEGVSIARNTGLELSIGKYVYFFDADDLLSKEFFQTVWNRLDKEEDEVDYLVAPMDFFTASPESPVRFLPVVDKNKDYLKEVLCHRADIWTQNMIWNGEFLKSQKSWWDGDLRICEDREFGCRMLGQAKCGIHLDIPSLIHIRFHENSTTSKLVYSEQSDMELVKSHLKIFDHCDQAGLLSGEIRTLQIRFLLRLCLVCLSHGNKQPAEQIKFFFANRKDQRYYAILIRTLVYFAPILRIAGRIRKKMRFKKSSNR